MERMQAIVNTGPGRLEMLEWPRPQPGPGQVRIRTAAVGICATDLQMIAGWDRTGFPHIPGHEWSGTVDATGEGVDPALVGVRCVAENAWLRGGEVGFDYPGAYGQYFVTEAQLLHPLPPDYPTWAAALIEPLAVCVRGRNRLGPVTQEPVLIVGDGPIGLLTLLLLLRDGKKDITLVGGRAPRLALAQELGAPETVDYHSLADELGPALRAKRAGGYPTVIEASGAESGIEAALEATHNEGRVLVLGDYAGARAAYPWNDLLHREWQIIGSCASGGAWPEAMRLAVEDKLPIHRLATHRLPAAQFESGVWLAKDHNRGSVKVVLEWE